MSDQTIKLDSEITIRNIQPVFSQLSELFTQTEILHIDASQLSRVDTAGAQLLHLFSRTCDARSLKVDWLGCQPDLLTNLRELGIILPHLQVDTLEENSL
ncbi:STAS domain-containing protein [Shewanella sp. D64]|uniref:STAS domain-containing protein n=1 Tax=unclassified Shewanella TaxID=196818 RepID=UPI0022BA47B6|nr:MULTISPECIES: STAS domain-containing protein [unclassified Shewanella]MEC4727960.1 STAS domain-containing protein [Shewanella sp. D64]MEC4740068.1 STAS domain-containing protein [Shewanella sp. E94]WBJ95837.1 STAS domain-containing protein [Shewanella sp. MTB7]